MHKYLKYSIFAAAILTLWLGPEQILLKNSAEEEKIHIALAVIFMAIITASKLTPGNPGNEDPATLNNFRRLLLLKKQLRYQWHLLKQQVPFSIKNSRVQLLIADKDSGKSTIMQGYGKISEQEMPFKIDWHYNKNSIICAISSELYPDAKAQHCQQLFNEINKFIQRKYRKTKIAKVYLIVSVTKLMHSSVDKCMDAFNYTLAAFANKKSATDIKIVLSKSDQIAGFLPYFEHHDSAVKNQSWQIKFSNLGAFNQAFGQLLHELNQNLISRMHTETQLYRRILIKDFPVQLEKLQQNILQNLQHLIQDKHWHVNELAFTSGTQDGKYTDLINLGMKTASQDLLIAKQRYFCNQIFDIPTINLKIETRLLSETWFQIIAILVLYTGAIIGYQAIWLQRFFDIQAFASKPINYIEKNANIWRRWQIAHEIEPWISNNPVPKHLGYNIWQKNNALLDTHLKKLVIQDAKTCEGNVYSCLSEKWQPFTTAKQLSMRLAWVQQHKQLLNRQLKLSKQDFEIANNNSIERLLKGPIPDDNIAQIAWLKDLAFIMEKSADKRSTARVQQLIAILEKLDNGLQSFKLLEQIDLSQSNLPHELLVLEQATITKLKNKVSEHINQVWQATVIKNYEKIKTKYPFNPESKQDISQAEFKRLIEMVRFFDNYYLTPAKKLGINAVQLDSLAAAENFLMDKDDFNLRFSFMAQDDLMSDISLAQLNIAGSISNLDKNKPHMYHWPITGSDDTISIWLQDTAGKLFMSSRHGFWGIFRLINSAGAITPGSHTAKLRFSVGEHEVDISIYFAKPWADLSVQLPLKII